MSRPNPYFNPYGHNPFMPPAHLMSTLYQQQQHLPPQFLPKDDGKSMVCKIYFTKEEETRRMKINREMNYEGILLFVENYLKPFGEGLVLHKMAYLDDEEEWVNFSTEGEWKDCMIQTFSKAKPILKIKVITKLSKRKVEKKKQVIPELVSMPVPKKKEEPEEEVELVVEEQRTPEPTEPSPTKHPYKCDICGMNPIVGRRYACTSRKDFDVCEKCYADRQKHGITNEGFKVYVKQNEIEYTIPPKKMMHTTVPKRVTPDTTDVKPLTSSVGRGQDKAEEPVPTPELQNVEPDFKNKIQLLKEMGFHDETKSLTLLRKHKGDLQAVVREHLSV